MRVDQSERPRPHRCGRCNGAGLVGTERCVTCEGWGSVPDAADGGWNYCAVHRCEHTSRNRGCPLCAAIRREKSRRERMQAAGK